MTTEVKNLERKLNLGMHGVLIMWLIGHEKVPISGFRWSVNSTISQLSIVSALESTAICYSVACVQQSADECPCL